MGREIEVSNPLRVRPAVLGVVQWWHHSFGFERSRNVIQMFSVLYDWLPIMADLRSPQRESVRHFFLQIRRFSYQRTEKSLSLGIRGVPVRPPNSSHEVAKTVFRGKCAHLICSSFAIVRSPGQRRYTASSTEIVDLRMIIDASQ